MWVNLVAGVFSVPTLGIPSLSLNDRIALLRDGVQQLKQYRDARRVANPSPRWDAGGSRPSMIFVAPEYMFVPPGFKLADMADLKRNRFLSRTEHDQIVAELQRISAEYGKELVFVPGTIAYREELPNQPVDRMQRVDIAKQQIKTAAKATEERFKSPGKSYLDTRVAGRFVGNESITPNQKLKALDVAKKYSSTFYTATNIAYLLTNGKIIGSYAKRSDFHERLPNAPTNTIFVPGIKPGRATVGGINFGIEVCLDHGLGVLINTPSITGVLPRVHLLCSATVKNKGMNVLVREGGYLVHASSDPDNSGIWRQLGGWQEPPNFESVYLNGSELLMGDIELDI